MPPERKTGWMTDDELNALSRNGYTTVSGVSGMELDGSMVKFSSAQINDSKSDSGRERQPKPTSK